MDLSCEDRLMSSEPTQQTTTTQAGIAPELQPFLIGGDGNTGLLPEAQAGAASLTNVRTGTASSDPLVATLTPAQRDLQQQQLDLGQRTLQGEFLDPNQAFLQNQISASVDPQLQLLQRQVLPQAQSQAIQEGAFGGSANALLQAQAIDNFNRQAQNTASNLIFANTQAERQRQQGAGAQLINPVLGAQQAEAQALIDAELLRPFIGLNEFGNIIGSAQGGFLNQAQTTPGQSPLSGAIQGGLGGAAVGGQVGGPYGALIGGGLGALAGGVQ
jgi:hypothetical protein